MEQKFKVVLSYLDSLTAGITIPEDQKSKEDPDRQTRAVEKLVQDTINKHLPDYADKVFAVGGFTRDQLLGKNPKDIDLVVDDPDTKMKAAEIFSKKFTDVFGITTSNNPHPFKEAYGIWGIVLFHPKDASGIRMPFIYDGVDVTGYVLELTPPRKEGPYDPEKREPTYVEYTSRADDALRRDLTINALYKNVASGEIEDYVGGKADLEKKILRPPEHPDGIESVYKEDPLRIFRLARFSGKLSGFKIDQDTEETLKKFISSEAGKKLIKEKVSPERIRDEFQQIITHPDASTAVRGLELLREYGLLSFLSPHLEKLLDIYHDKVFHSGESVWQHTMEVMGKTPPTLKARLSALLHDIGKIDTVSKETDVKGRERVHFKEHETKGLALAEGIMRELKFPLDVMTSVRNIIHGHMGFKQMDEQKSSTQLRRMRIFIEKLYDDFDDAIALLKADARIDGSEKTSLEALEKKLRDQRDKDLQSGLLQKKDHGMEYPYPLSGEQIMAEHDIKGKALGVLKGKLRQLLMEGHFEGLDEQQRAEKAKSLLKGFTVNQQVLDSMMKKFDQSRSDFYSVK
jgi:putative nucleotidyltransferase with HDIG domain